MTRRRSKGVADRLKALRKLLRDKSRDRSQVETNCIHRLIRDFENEGASGLVWNEEEAQRTMRFTRLFRHWQAGQHAGKRFEAEPWQEHLVFAPLFGWYRETDSGLRRRFNVSYVEIPRKNGKTLTSSIIANQGLLADREAGPEVYFAATTRDQASRGFRDAQNTMRQSRELMRRVTLFRNSTSCPRNLGTLQPVSADYNFLQGKSPSRVVIDELHAHKNRRVWDALRTGFGARRNPLLFTITTAGFDRTSICWEQHEIASKVAAGEIEEPTLHSLITCADAEDDPFDPATWKKANPNYGVSVDPETLIPEARAAQQSPAYENTFRNLYLNQWTSQSVLWFNVQKMWDPLADETIDWAKFKGRKCYVGLDLSSTRDLTAMAILFPDEENNHVWVRMVFWMPEKAANKRAAADRMQIEQWATKKAIRKTSGDEIDCIQVARDIWKELGQYQVQDIAYDPAMSAVSICQQLQDMGVPHHLFTKFWQSKRNYTPAVHQMNRLLGSRLIHHDGDPVLRWNWSNMALEGDEEYCMPSKEEGANKIDGGVAVLMGAGRWATLVEGQVKPTYYDDVDVLETVG